MSGEFIITLSVPIAIAYANTAIQTHCNRWKRLSDKGVFARIMVGMTVEYGAEKIVMMDNTCLKAK